jgi:putative membrane protein insertion efficiency factor
MPLAEPARGRSSDAERVAPRLAGWRFWPRDLLIGLVRAYRFALSPWLGSACRFEPTCSRYALEALARHGALAGGALTAGRLLRCQPWCAGGCDAVPEARPRLFRHLFPEASAASPPPCSGALPEAASPASPSIQFSSGPPP